MLELIKKYYNESLILDKRFDNIKEKKWDYLTTLNEISVQISHVFIVSSNSNMSEKNRNINNLGDEVSDVFFQLILLIHYLDYDVSKIEYNITENKLEDFVIAFGQLTEAILEKANFRFHKARENFKSIDDYIYFKISQLFSIIFNYAKLKGIDIDKEYSLMLKDANDFLDNK